jgi:hypothetical protein
MSLAALRQQLSQIVEPAEPQSPGLPTGVAALDLVLRDGIRRGRLTEIAGAPGSGRTTLVRRLVETALADELSVAYVDASRTLDPRGWAHLGRHEGFRVVRPADRARGAWCADVLLRSGAFALVVLDGAPLLPHRVALRLVGLAHEKDAALVVLGEEGGGSRLAGALRLAVSLVSGRHIAIAVEKGGTRQRVEVSCAIDMARRLCAHPAVPDRRGVGRRSGRSERSRR